MDRLTFANRVLSRIGSQRISSLSDNSEGAVLISRDYESSVREFLSRYNWRSAIKTQALVLANQEKMMPAKYRFFIPDDSCRVVVVLDESFNEINYVMEGQYLYTNTENTHLKYVAYNEFLIGYGEDLIEALVMNMAVKLPLKVGQSPQLAAMIEQKAFMATSRAMKVDRVQRRRVRNKKTWANPRGV